MVLRLERRDKGAVDAHRREQRIAVLLRLVVRAFFLAGRLANLAHRR